MTQGVSSCCQTVLSYCIHHYGCEPYLIIQHKADVNMKTVSFKCLTCVSGHCRILYRWGHRKRVCAPIWSLQNLKQTQNEWMALSLASTIGLQLLGYIWHRLGFVVIRPCFVAASKFRIIKEGTKMYHVRDRSLGMYNLS